MSNVFAEIPSFNPRLKEISEYSLLKNIKLKEMLKENNTPIFDFGIGDPQEPTPDFIQTALKNNITSISQYPIAIGGLELRKACQNWVQRKFQISLKLEQILSSNGSKESIFHIPQVFINPTSTRRNVIIPTPAYPVYRSGTIMAGGTPIEVPLSFQNHYVFSHELLSKDIIDNTVALWINYPHNPTGAEISLQEMDKIYQFALKHNIILLSDECYVEMCHFNDSQKSHPSFLTIAEKYEFKNLLCFFSLSKRSGMTGYRSGFVTGDKNLIQAFAMLRPHAGLATPTFVQKAAQAAWEDDEHVHKRNDVFLQKKLFIERFFEKKRIAYIHSPSLFYLWAEIPQNFSTAIEFTEKLAQKTGIILTPGESFGQGFEKYFRIALVPTLEDIKHCLPLWEKFLKDFDL